MSKFFDEKSGVINLSPDDFDEHQLWKLKQNNGCTAILFYATWCPYCVEVKPAWAKLGKTVKFMDIAAFECDTYPEHLNGLREEKPELIPSFPTMWIYKGDSPSHKIGTTKRDYTDLLRECMSACQDKNTNRHL